MRTSLRDRFLAKISVDLMSTPVVDNSPCWIWRAAIHRATGYGRFGVTRRNTDAAHRVAYRLWYGEIPAGLEIDHLCRVRACVNPAHLEAVTHQVNVRRGTSHATRWPTPDGTPKRVRTDNACPEGHVFTSENTYLNNGKKVCRECMRRYKRDFYWRRKARRFAP